MAKAIFPRFELVIVLFPIKPSNKNSAGYEQDNLTGRRHSKKINSKENKLTEEEKNRKTILYIL